MKYLHRRSPPAPGPVPKHCIIASEIHNFPLQGENEDVVVTLYKNILCLIATASFAHPRITHHMTFRSLFFCFCQIQKIHIYILILSLRLKTHTNLYINSLYSYVEFQFIVQFLPFEFILKFLLSFPKHCQYRIFIPKPTTVYYIFFIVSYPNSLVRHYSNSSSFHSKPPCILRKFN